MKAFVLIVALALTGCMNSARTADLAVPRGFAPPAPKVSAVKKQRPAKPAAATATKAEKKSDTRPVTFRERFGQWKARLVPFWKAK